MSRLLLLVAAATLLIPVAQAVPPNADVTIRLDVPAAATSAQSNATVPITIGVSVENLGCLPGPGVLTVSLAATSSGNITASVVPSSVQFDMQPASVNGYTPSDRAANVMLSSDEAAMDNVTITATVTGLSGCQGATAAGAPVTKAIAATFQPSNNLETITLGDEAPVPGFELPLLALAVLGAVLIRRRKA